MGEKGWEVREKGEGSGRKEIGTQGENFGNWWVGERIPSCPPPRCYTREIEMKSIRVLNMLNNVCAICLLMNCFQITNTTLSPLSTSRCQPQGIWR